jgi:hypothetical protein
MKRPDRGNHPRRVAAGGALHGGGGLAGLYRDATRLSRALTKSPASAKLTPMDRRHLDIAQIIRTILRMVG